MGGALSQKRHQPWVRPVSPGQGSSSVGQLVGVGVTAGLTKRWAGGTQRTAAGTQGSLLSSAMNTCASECTRIRHTHTCTPRHIQEKKSPQLHRIALSPKRKHRRKTFVKGRPQRQRLSWRYHYKHLMGLLAIPVFRSNVCCPW